MNPPANYHFIAEDKLGRLLDDKDTDEVFGAPEDDAPATLTLHYIDPDRLGEVLGDREAKDVFGEMPRTATPAWYAYENWNAGEIDMGDFAPGSKFLIGDALAGDRDACDQALLKSKGMNTVPVLARLAKAYIRELVLPSDEAELATARKLYRPLPKSNDSVKAWETWVQAHHDKLVTRILLGIGYFRADVASEEKKSGNA